MELRQYKIILFKHFITRLNYIGIPEFAQKKHKVKKSNFTDVSTEPDVSTGYLASNQ